MRLIMGKIAPILAAAAAGAVAALARGVRQPGPPLPGDRLVRRATTISTISAVMPGAPEQVWPWLAQMGAGRGGWYGFDLIDNGGMPSATEIVPELQRLAPGDVMEASTFGGPPFIATQVDEPRVLVTTLRARRGWMRASYAYVLAPVDGGTLLTTRLRMGGRPGIVALLLAPMMLASHEVAQRVQLARLRRRISAR